MLEGPYELIAWLAFFLAFAFVVIGYILRELAEARRQIQRLLALERGRSRREYFVAKVAPLGSKQRNTRN